MGMLYRSTMGKDGPVDTRTMVFKGIPDDGGLYMPTRWNRFSMDDIYSMGDMPLPEIGYRVGKRLFGDDIPDYVLKDIAEGALNFEIAIEHLEDNIHIMRLDRGPTGAFKDFAARYMARVIGYYAQYLDREMVIIVATSGDTGSAVANAFYKIPGIQVYVMYPRKEVTDTQAMLMDVLGENIHTRAVDAKFDDLQKWSDYLMEDPDLKHIRRNTANSKHLLRLLPQTIYHLYGSSRVRKGDGLVVKSDASGNFGNMTADVIAMKYLGNPVERIIVATNENDEFPLFMATNVYGPITSRDCISNAMNVGNPSNLRRLFDIYGGRIDRKGNILKMPATGAMRRELFAISVSDKLTNGRIKESWARHKKRVEPHGAVALEGAYRYKRATGTDSPILVTETAAPWKFPKELEELDVGVETPDWVLDMRNKPRIKKDLPGNYEAIKEDFLTAFE